MFDDLEDLNAFNRSAAKPKAARETFPCGACSGTGRYQGARLHQPRSECFACGGKGYFYTSERDRQKKRQQAADRKQAKTNATREEFEKANPGLIKALSAICDWNSFAASMIDSFAQYGRLTDGQVAASQRMLAKIAARREAKAQQASAASGAVDLGRIKALFDTAVASGLKKPGYRAMGLSLTRAADHSRNPGAIYVKVLGGDYCGKVQGTAFHAVGSCPGDVLPKLQKIAADPRGAAVEYGRLTGSCSCCGRTLTDPASIEAGIGPICASKWGL